MNRMLSPLAGALIALSPLAASAETVQVAHPFPESGAQGRIDQAFGKDITDSTGGALAFKFFWSGSLGAGNEIVHLIRDGAISYGVSAPAYYAAEMPVAGLTNGTPFLFAEAATAMRLQDELSRTNPHFLAEYERMGVFPILQHGLTASRLMCTRKVASTADLNALRVRSFGAYLPVALQALGAVPVTMSTADMYEGLQRGTVDCVPVSYATAGAFRLHEVARFWTDLNLGASSGPVFYTSWENYKDGGWGDDLRAAVDAASARAMETEIAMLVADDKAALDAAIAAGVTFTPFADPDAVYAKVPDMVALWKDTQIAKGMDATVAAEVADAVRAAIVAEKK
ncbi:TRAP transporter substrate-binding protein DctP [Gemmobacter sp.]|uniref:TRAP transporter substrate-binding protein DctP n=1 Tax=Gemmobacter sp. TaxID=1898957 RepID=UPI002AFF5877|nr:TRAP transporter substrate-binding protein DctP [Gemmobacter sp.]